MKEKLKAFMNSLVDIYMETSERPKEKVIRFKKEFLCWATIEFASLTYPDTSLKEAYDTVKQVYEEMEKNNGQ